MAALTNNRINSVITETAITLVYLFSFCTINFSLWGQYQEMSTRSL